MEKPKFMEIVSMDNETKEKVEDMINKTLQCDYIKCYPLVNLTLIELDLLAEYTKVNNLILTIKAEHSNFHSGVIVQLLKKDLT